MLVSFFSLERVGNKKKTKDKTKQILNVEVNFSNQREETLLNENSVLSDDEQENINK